MWLESWCRRWVYRLQKVGSDMSKRLLLGFALIVALAAGCFTPSVPIPPPEPEDMSFELDTTTGTATYRADPNPSYGGAIVSIFNRTQGSGSITTANDDGSVDPTPFPGVDGDEVVVMYELGRERAAVCVELHEGRSSSAFECRL